MVIVAKHVIKEGRVDDYIALAEKLVAETRKEEGCIAYALYQDSKDENVLTFIEEWESRDAIKAHFASTHFQKMVPLMKECMEGDVDLRYYNRVAE